MADEEVVDEDEEHEGHEHRHKKRKKVERQLDEEDLELIHENIGVEVKKKKRLQKQSEREGVKEEVHEEVMMIDTSSRREPVVQEPVDTEKASTARQIFEDPAMLAQRVAMNKGGKESGKGARTGGIEEYFDGDEIDD